MPQTAAAGLVGAAILLFVAAPLTGTPAQAAPMTTHATTQTVTTAAARAATPVTGADQRRPTPEPARATASHTQAQTTPARPDPATVEHVVERGETLWSLAERYLGAGSRYTELADLNRDVLGPNPGFLTVGQVLQVPAATSTTGAHPDKQMVEHVVTVHRGDTLSQIAEEELGDARQVPRDLRGIQGHRAARRSPPERPRPDPARLGAVHPGQEGSRPSDTRRAPRASRHRAPPARVPRAGRYSPADPADSASTAGTGAPATAPADAPSARQSEPTPAATRVPPPRLPRRH